MKLLILALTRKNNFSVFIFHHLEFFFCVVSALFCSARLLICLTIHARCFACISRHIYANSQIRYANWTCIVLSLPAARLETAAFSLFGCENLCEIFSFIRI